MFVAYVGTVLDVLAGVSLLLALVMALSWGARGGLPGFGMWTISNLVVAVCSIVLAHGDRLPLLVIVIVLPWLLVLAATLRLDGVRRFLGRERFDYRVLPVPLVALGLLLYFWYGSRNDLARAVVAAGSIALLFGVLAGVMIPRGRRDRSLFELLLGTVFGSYAALLVGYAIFWSVGSGGLPLSQLTRPNLAFGVLIILFEIAWVVILLTMGDWRERQSLQVARAASESARQQLATLVDFLPDATFAVDRDLNMIGWNRAAEQLTGVAAEEVLGRSYDQYGRSALTADGDTLVDLVLDPAREIPARYVNAHWEADRLSAEREADFPANPNQGRHLWLTATVVRDQGGAVIGAVESMRDVSSREHAERLIRQREQQFRSLFELNLDGILAVAPDGSIYDANPAACEMLGMTKEEICAAGHSGIVRREAGAEERVQTRLLSGREMQEFTFVRKDKTTFPAECMSVVYCDSLGLPRAFVEFRDVTEQREAQRVLRESEARLVQAMAVAQVGDWEIDLVARSLWLSPEALRIHGLEGTPSYLPLDNADTSAYFEDPEPVIATMQRLAREGGSFELEYQAKRADGGSSRRVRVKGQAVCDGNGSPVKARGCDAGHHRVAAGGGRPQAHPVLCGPRGRADLLGGPDGRFMYVSDSTCEQLGYTRDELLGDERLRHQPGG